MMMLTMTPGVVIPLSAKYGQTNKETRYRQNFEVTFCVFLPDSNVLILTIISLYLENSSQMTMLTTTPIIAIDNS